MRGGRAGRGRPGSGAVGTYLVDRLLALFVLLGLLLHLLPLLDVIDEGEQVTQVDDERLRLDRDAKTQIFPGSFPFFPRCRRHTYRLGGLDGHELVVALLPTDVPEGPVVPGVLGDVADLVDRVVMEKHLRNKQPPK